MTATLSRSLWQASFAQALANYRKEKKNNVCGQTKCEAIRLEFQIRVCLRHSVWELYSQLSITLAIKDVHLWDSHNVSVLLRCPSYKESTKRSKERQEPTLGLRFSEVPVL